MERKYQNTMHSVPEAAVLKINFKVCLQEFCYLMFLKPLSSWGLYCTRQATLALQVRGEAEGLKRAGPWDFRMLTASETPKLGFKSQNMKDTVAINTDKLRDRRPQHYLMRDDLRDKGKYLAESESQHFDSGFLLIVSFLASYSNFLTLTCLFPPNK